MNKIIQKFIDQKFLSQEQGELVEKAVNEKRCIVVAGHRSAGIRPFLANLMMMAKSLSPDTKQVKNIDDINDKGIYYLIPSIDGADFEALIDKAITGEHPFISIKEPETPYSIMKLLKKASKANPKHSLKYTLIDCDKENNVPFVVRITELELSDEGKIQKNVSK